MKLLILFSTLAIMTCIHLPAANATPLPWLPQRLQDPFATEQKANKLIPPELHPDSCQNITDFHHKLHFREVVLTALCNNPDTKSAYYSLLSQAANYGGSYSAYFPNAEASVGFSRSSSFSQYGIILQNSEASGLNAGITLYDFGHREATLDAAEQALIATGQNYDSTLQNTIAAALEGYYRLLTSQNAVTATYEAEHYARDSYNAAALRHQIGQVALADTLQAKGAYAQAILAREQAENQLSLDRGALALQMGLPPDQSIEVAELNNYALMSDPFGGNVQALIEKATSERYDLKAARTQIESTKASLRATERADLPSISASASIAGTHPNLFNSGNPRDQTAGITISIPIFTGFSQTYNERAARHELEAQEEQLNKTELTVKQDVWNSWHNYKTARQTWETSRDLLASSEQLKDVALGRYKEGLGTILDVLSAQSQYSGALQSMLQSRYNLLTTRIDLVRAVGMLSLDTINPGKNMDAPATTTGTYEK